MKISPYICMVCKSIVIAEPHSLTCMGQFISAFQIAVSEDELKEIKEYNELMEIYS